MRTLSNLTSIQSESGKQERPESGRGAVQAIQEVKDDRIEMREIEIFGEGLAKSSNLGKTIGRNNSSIADSPMSKSLNDTKTQFRKYSMHSDFGQQFNKLSKLPSQRLNSGHPQLHQAASQNRPSTAV